MSTTFPIPTRRATLDDLARTECKAELIDGKAPDFAIEVRSETDYDAAADLEMAAKRTDYFAAGTSVVWDVDPIAEVIHVYRAAAPDRPVTIRRGEQADAEPAVPGWRVALDWIFA